MMNEKFLQLAAVFLGFGLFAAHADNWPAWRCEDGNGAVDGELPADLNSALLWKAELPGRGCSTPAVWKDRIFLTSAIGEEDGVLAFDADGKEVWRKVLGKLTPGRGQRVGSGANSSPVIDGEQVFVYFKSGEVAALSLDGKLNWRTNLQEKYGEDKLWWDQGTSPVFAGGNLVIAVMQTDGKSYLVSLDKKTGKEVWLTERKYEVTPETGDSYTTPQVVEVDGVETIVTWGADHLTGHDAKNGAILWECGGFNPNNKHNWRVIASQVVDGDLAVVPFARGDSVAGIRLGGKGNVTDEAWVWKEDGVGSDAVTPILSDGKVYVLKDGGKDRGKLWCLEAKTGKRLWEARFPKAPQVFYASPILVDDQFICAREDGMVMSGKVSDEGLSDVKEFRLEEGVIASPVFVDGKLFLRGDQHLFCFGSK